MDKAHQAIAKRSLPGLVLFFLGSMLTNACDTDGTSSTDAQGKEDAGTEDAGSVVVAPSDAQADPLGSDLTPKVFGPFAEQVIDFTPGSFAGYGQDKFPSVVLGPPQGGGASAGSLDVLTLGMEGCIVLAFADREIVDGDGADFLVFENPFSGFYETGVVSVSGDGSTWATFPCAATDKAANYPGCAGTHYVYASPGNGIDPTDPTTAGGDPYDLRDLGLSAARFVRVCDSGQNSYAGTSGGFDLDTVAVVHGRSLVQ